MLQGQADRCYAQEWSAEEQRTLELGLVKWPQVSNLLHSSWKQLAGMQSNGAGSVHTSTCKRVWGPQVDVHCNPGAHTGPGAVPAHRGHAVDEGRT